MVVSARSFTGVDQGAAPAPVSAMGISRSVSSAPGQLVVDWALHGGNTATATVGGGQTLDVNRVVSASNHDLRGIGSHEAGATSTTMSWALTAAKPWGTLALALEPAGG